MAIAAVCLATTTVLTSCSSSDDTTTLPVELSATDFAPACAGQRVAHAKAYDPKGRRHAALFLQGHPPRGSNAGDLVDRSFTLPGTWTIDKLGKPGNPLGAIDLILCAVPRKGPLVRVCTGYGDNSTYPLHNRVRLYGATYRMTVRDAASGRELPPSRSVEVRTGACPDQAYFSRPFETRDLLIDPPRAALVAALARFLR